MSAALRFSKTTPADSPERVSGKAFQALPPKQNGPLFSGPLVSDIEPISWPGQAPERVQELVPEQAPVLAQEPVRALVRLAWPVQRASSVQPARAPEPVCSPLAARRVPDARRFCRKRNTRQSPG